MQPEELTLTADDGAALAVYRWQPTAASPRGAVQIAHGMAEHAARYAPLAEALVAEGYLVHAHDHRGHGKTASDHDDLGWFAANEGWARAVADVHALNRFVAEGYPELPRCLLGHSMGSFMTLAYLLDHADQVDAAVLSGTSVGGGALVHLGRVAAKLERLRQGPRGTSALLAFLSFGSFNKGFEPARTEFDWLSRDPAEVDKYIRDPRCGFRCTNQLWVDFLGGLIELGRDDRLAQIRSELPMYVFAGALDPVGNEGKGVAKLVAKLRGAGLGQVTQRLYPEGRHEMLNETNRDEVQGHLLAWLDQHLPPAGAQ